MHPGVLPVLGRRYSDVMTEVSRSDASDARPASESELETATVDERTVAYVEYGEPTGKPVVFLHGMPGSRVFGELFDDVARERDVRLLAFDRPGYGKSDPWPGRTLSDTGTLVEAVLDDAGVSSAGVVGFSAGGPHALAFAATRPDSVTSVDVVAGAPPPSLVDSAPRTQRLLSGLAQSFPRLLRGLVRGQAWLVDRASPSLVVSQYATDEGRRAIPPEMAAVVKRDFLAAVGEQRSGMVTEARLLAREWDVSLDDVRSAVRLWHGEADTNVPVAGARNLAETLPRSALTVFDGADHLNAFRRSQTRVLDEQRSSCARRRAAQS